MRIRKLLHMKWCMRNLSVLPSHHHSRACVCAIACSEVSALPRLLFYLPRYLLRLWLCHVQVSSPNEFMNNGRNGPWKSRVNNCFWRKTLKSPPRELNVTVSKMFLGGEIICMQWMPLKSICTFISLFITYRK